MPIYVATTLTINSLKLKSHEKANNKGLNGFGFGCCWYDFDATG
jgi:hypothetical protein